MKLVEVPGVGDVEFPDDISDDEIGEVIRREYDSGDGRVASAAKAFMRGGGDALGKAVTGIARVLDWLPAASGTDSEAATDRAMEEQNRKRKRTPEQRELEIASDPLHVAGQALAEGARESWRPNPRYAGEFWSDVIPGSAGQMVPTIALGMVNPTSAIAQYGLTSGAQGAEEALAAGRQDIANLAALGYGAAGAVSEATLGVPANVLKRFYRPVKAGVQSLGRTVGKAATHEAAQEGGEQVIQNLIAKEWDPERDWHQGVVESMAAGAILGGPIGGAAGLVARARTAATESNGEPEVSIAPPPAPEENELPAPEAADTPIPESSATISAQLAATADPSGTKAVTLIVPGSPEVEIPEGLDDVNTPQGVAVFNPEKTDRPTVEAAGAGEVFDGRLLGMASQAKPGPGQSMVAVATRAPDGTPEVVAELVAADPLSIAAAVEAQQAASPGAITEVLEPGELLRERTERAEAEKGVEIAPGLTESAAEAPAGAAGTITGLNEQVGSEMPAEREQRLKPPPASSSQDRPWDIIDHIENNLGRLDVRLFREADPHFKPVGAARKLFRVGSGMAGDIAAEALARDGIFKGDPAKVDQLGAAILEAAALRKSAKATASREERWLREQAKQTEQFDRAVRRGERPKAEKENVELVRANDLLPGDSFEVRGVGFKVEDAQYSEDGSLQGLTLKDGPKYGVQTVGADEWLHVDFDTMDQSRREAPSPSIGQKILTKLDELDRGLSSGMYSDPLLLTPLAKLALKIAKVLVRGGMALDVAIREAVKRAREQMPAAPDDDSALVEAMETGIEIRQFTGQIDTAQDIADPVKQAVENRLYERKPNEDTAAFAGRIAEATGDAAIEVFRDQTNGLAGAERTMLGQLIVKRLSAAGRHEDAARFLDQDLLPYSTNAGQALQAFAAFARLTPTGALVYAKRQFDRAGQSARERVKPAVDALADNLRKINEQGAEGTANTPEVQTEAGAAIDEALQEQANQLGTPVHAAITEDTIEQMRLAGQLTDAQADGLRRILRGEATWQEVFGDGSKAAQESYKEARRKSAGTVKARARKAREKRDARPDSADRILRRMAESQSDTLKWKNGKKNPDLIAQAVREQVRSGKLTWEDFREKLERCGVTSGTATALMEATRRERTIRGRIEQERKRQAGAAEPVNPETRTAEAMIRAYAKVQSDTPSAAATAPPNSVRQMVDRQLERQEWTPDEFARELTAVGVTPEEAATLSRVVFRELAAREIAAEHDPSPVDRAIRAELTRLRMKLGALVRQHFTQVDSAGRTIEERLVAEAGLPEEAAARLGRRIRRRFVELVAEAKERELARLTRVTPRPPARVKPAFQRIIELSNLGGVSRESVWNAVAEKLKLPKWTPEIAAEVQRRAEEIQRTPEGFQRDAKVVEMHNYLARAMGVPLSDLAMAFWYANILSGPTTHAVNLLANIQNVMADLAVQARNPQDWLQQVVALGRGLKRGGSEAAAILRTGIVTRTGDLKLQASRPLELWRLNGWKDYLVTPWRMVGRALAASDAVLFRGGEEMRRTLLTRQMARQEGLRGTALQRRVAELGGRLESQRVAAEEQAKREGLSGNTYRRRVAELLDEPTPESVRENAREYALRLTFNQKPYGLLGAAAESINHLAGKFGIVRLVAPFTNIVSNVANEALNYVPPVGLARAVHGHWKGELEGKPIDQNALGDQYGKAALGIVLLGVIWAAKEAASGDDDPWFDISGAGPTSKGRRDQLRASGWIPNAIKIKDRWYSYANSPISIALAAIGNFSDATKYRGLDERGAWDRLAFVIQNFGKVLTEQSFLNGLADLAGAINRDSVKSGDNMVKSLGRTAASFVTPNALSQLDRWFDPTVYDAKTVEAALVSSVPFARRLDRPALNLWGQPVRSEVGKRFTSEWKPTRIESALLNRGLWIPAPQRDAIQVDGQPLTEDEFYEYIRTRGNALLRLLGPTGVVQMIETGADDAVKRVWGRLTHAANASALVAVRRMRTQEAAGLR